MGSNARVQTRRVVWKPAGLFVKLATHGPGMSHMTGEMATARSALTVPVIFGPTFGFPGRIGLPPTFNVWRAQLQLSL